MLIRFTLLLLTLLFSNIALADVASLLLPGELIKGHAKLEAQCPECHLQFDKGAQTRLCRDCHKEVAADILKHKGFHGRLDEITCHTCHTDHKGRAAKIVTLDSATFDHDKTDFRLRGAHQKPEKVKCVNCHEANKKYRDAPPACNGCHKKDDKHKGALGSDCGNCHVEKNWKEAKFDHSTTQFLLRGKHVDVTCQKCHADPSRYKETPHECVACHRKDDKHKEQYGKKCESCHTDSDWGKVIFDHNQETKFRLRGKHEQVKCQSCHKSALYKEKIPATCVSCHKKEDTHKGGLGDKCESCHNEEKWKSSRFDHDKNTKYPLLGKHMTAKCTACHKPESKEKLATTCVVCHQSNDKHKGNFGTRCESCHFEKDWKAISFDHGRDTKYLLRWSHNRVKCTACHTEKIAQQKLGPECHSCHKKDDVHKDKLGKRCESCHDEKSWKEAHIDHSRARFPLLGSHIKVECNKCHTTKLYKDTATDCFSCHQKDDANTHKLRLGKKCDTCHSARSWKTWDFNHDTRTKFKLDGAHKKAVCYACHKKSVPDRMIVPVACAACHEEDDTHQGDFGQQCERCHVTSNFRTLLIGAQHH
ncbi:MAG: cytochrome C [Nitrosomonadales bacterium]